MEKQINSAAESALVEVKIETSLTTEPIIQFDIEDIAHKFRTFYQKCGEKRYPQTVYQAAVNVYQSLMNLAFMHHLFEDEQQRTLNECNEQ